MTSIPITKGYTSEKNATRYILDIASAVVSACAVAPCIAIIDQAVTEKTADKSLSLGRSVLNNITLLFTKPMVFVSKPTFAFVCLVYSATYVAANTITSYCEINGQDSYYPKLVGTTVVNMGFGIAKDRYFAKVFNKSAPAKFPMISWGLFCVRDLLTIGAGFNFPTAAAKYLHSTGWIESYTTCDKLTQVSVPMLAQLALTPIHTLSLDFYNRKTEPLSGRIRYVASIFPETVTIRMGRVLSAYGIAGVTNKELKKVLYERFL